MMRFTLFAFLLTYFLIVASHVRVVDKGYRKIIMKIIISYRADIIVAYL